MTSKRQRDKESCAGSHEKRTSTLVNDGMASRLTLARRWPEWQNRKWSHSSEIVTGCLPCWPPLASRNIRPEEGARGRHPL